MLMINTSYSENLVLIQLYTASTVAAKKRQHTTMAGAEYSPSGKCAYCVVNSLLQGTMLPCARGHHVHLKAPTLQRDHHSRG